MEEDSNIPKYPEGYFSEDDDQLPISIKEPPGAPSSNPEVNNQATTEKPKTSSMFRRLFTRNRKGGRKSRKSRKTRKSRKSRKTRKSRK